MFILPSGTRSVLCSIYYFTYSYIILHCKRFKTRFCCYIFFFRRSQGPLVSPHSLFIWLCQWNYYASTACCHSIFSELSLNLSNNHRYVINPRALEEWPFFCMVSLSGIYLGKIWHYRPLAKSYPSLT